LYITPVYYVYIEQAHRWLVARRRTPARTPADVAVVEHGASHASPRSAEISG
jgi:hypothetical protein